MNFHTYFAAGDFPVRPSSISARDIR